MSTTHVCVMTLFSMSYIKLPKCISGLSVFNVIVDLDDYPSVSNINWLHIVFSDIATSARGTVSGYVMYVQEYHEFLIKITVCLKYTLL